MAKPIRVAQIMGKLWAGGVEAVVFNYYRAIDKEKIQFDFFYDADSTVEPPQDLIDMGAHFYKIPPYQNLINYLKTLKSYLKMNRYVIVHSHINTLSIFPLYAAWRVKIPIRIAHNHSVPGGKEFKRNALKYFLKMFSKIFSTDYFACSEKAGRWMWGDSTYEKGKVYIVKNAIDFKRFKTNDSEAETLRTELDVKGKFIVGHVGRFTYAKNHMFLISIFKEICKFRKDAVLLLVGDGELHDQIVNELKKNEIQDKSILIGKVTCPEKYYGIFNVVILPSIFEGLPLTAIESQVAGVPILVSDAIPKEAQISNAFIRKSLSISSREWAKTAIELSNVKLVLNEKSKEFNIIDQANELCKWYVERSKRLM